MKLVISSEIRHFNWNLTFQSNFDIWKKIVILSGNEIFRKKNSKFWVKLLILSDIWYFERNLKFVILSGIWCFQSRVDWKCEFLNSLIEFYEVDSDRTPWTQNNLLFYNFYIFLFWCMLMVGVCFISYCVWLNFWQTVIRFKHFWRLSNYLIRM